jgi:hypothetical protein
MNGQQERTEQAILDALRRNTSMTMERLVEALPHASWNCVFHAVDTLSRHGRLAVHRRGFEYVLSLPDRPVQRLSYAAWC